MRNPNIVKGPFNLFEITLKVDIGQVLILIVDSPTIWSLDQFLVTHYLLIAIGFSLQVR